MLDSCLKQMISYLPVMCKCFSDFEDTLKNNVMLLKEGCVLLRKKKEILFIQPYSLIRLFVYRAAKGAGNLFMSSLKHSYKIMDMVIEEVRKKYCINLQLFDHETKIIININCLYSSNYDFA